MQITTWLLVFSLLLSSCYCLLVSRPAVAERALGELWKADLTLRLDETYISSPQMFRPDSTGFPEVVDLLVQTSVLPITLAELNTVSEIFHVPLEDGAKESAIKRLTPATWNGLGVVTSLPGSAGSTSHSSKNVQAGNFTFARSSGPGSYAPQILGCTPW